MRLTPSSYSTRGGLKNSKAFIETLIWFVGGAKLVAKVGEPKLHIHG